MAKMTAKQQLFCDEYLVDLNATQAAIRAGYTEKYANTNAFKLLQITAIKQQIEKLQAERSARTEITQDQVIKELANIAFSDITNYVKVVEKDATIEVNGQLAPLLDENGERVKYKTVEPVLTEDLTAEQTKAIEAIKKGRDGFELKTYNKLRALELLGQHLGMWNKKAALDLEEQQARIEKIKAETARARGEDLDADQQDDGFIEALKSEVSETWGSD